MKVPVYWVSRHPEILARGYADEGLLEAVLARSVWRPADPLTFEHLEVRGGFPDTEGAVVILPARHHASPEDVEWFKGQLDRLAWAVVVLAGDEEWVFPWAEVPETPTRKVWVMQPRTEHRHLSGLIPGGWYPHTDIVAAQHRDQADARPLDWMFAGQVTHARRKQAVSVLRRLKGGFLHETDGYLRGMPQDEYWRLLAGTKIVPCPSGPMTVDTARPLEAMELGCIPVVDLMTPSGPQTDYWALVFGETHSLPTITDWRRFPRILGEQLADWPANANRVFSFWQAWKRRIAFQLDDDIRAVSGQQRTFDTPDDRITVLVSTSPVPDHPSTHHIEQTVESIRTQLPHVEILIAVDGVRPEQTHRKADYDEYTRRLLWLANNQWSNVLPVVMGEWVHQAEGTRRLLESVRTPLIAFVEHDTPLMGDIDWVGITDILMAEKANVIRFHIDESIHPDHERIMLDRETQLVDKVPLRRTIAWWQRPHVARTDFYRNHLMPLFSPEDRTMIEDVVYSLLESAYSDHGDAGWAEWGVWVYTPDGGMKRSGHTDARGDDPKYPMTHPVFT